MFTKILVANRGEIAVRVMRTCRELGVATVAVRSRADADSLHARTADESIDLGDGPASTTYLDIGKIVDAARRSGAEAIHPGYGFLAENAEFAQAVQVGGLTFIGPSSHAISTMGEKVAAREVAVAAGVPLAPGSDGSIASARDVTTYGAEHGYPVLVKASFGGGGRGMREIRSADEAEEAFAAAQREATAAFGNGELYCERYLVNARHVEVQVIGDSHGSVIYLGDRDCTVQRRHQKLIEEAPAPGLSENLRVRMGEAAVRLARAVDYVGLGTVEFLLEGENFYFLEMNTRIQVEHPVTEAVTGLDLVALQLRIAAGEPLGIRQDEVPREGAAVEVRVNAEDGSGGLFIPSPGKIELMDVPQSEGFRWDSGYESGDEVLPLYDSLIGKAIMWAPARDEAIDALVETLGHVTIEGVATTIPAARFILDTPAFRQAEINTIWLEKSVSIPHFALETDPELDRFEVEVAGRYYRIPYLVEGPSVGVPVDGPVPGQSDPSTASRSGVGARRSGGRSRQKANDGLVKSPMQGTIVKVAVGPDQEVTAGDVLFVLEAMKMENPIRASHAGRISKVHVEIGDPVPAGHLLADYAAEEPSDD